MKYLSVIILFITTCISFGQNVQTDATTYTPQQLIEDILIDSNCIENVVVTNVIGGDFNNTDQSYGYFDAAGTSFPFQNGIVLSTGRLQNVEGPNNTLSDDDAPNWVGDADLEYALQEQNTLNATIIEFEFTAVADRISFRYLFASEEYQENSTSTCQYSDLFGFLIKSANQQQYENIAVVPNTREAVKVTTVHPYISNDCPAVNETYFGSWNNATAPINFNGQTAVLTATADVIPNERYSVKLVIADEQNYRYDSAVFLEAGSFELNTNLGLDRLVATNNPLCVNETMVLDATQPGNNTYKWFKDGIELFTETNATLTVLDAGTYNVEVTLTNCISFGEVTIEYATNPLVFNTSITDCDPNADGLTTYNLTEPYISANITNNVSNLVISNYYVSNIDGVQNTNPISTPSTFNNTIANQIVYARVENQFGCFAIAEISLQTSNTNFVLAPFEICDDISNDGITIINLTQIKQQIEQLVPANTTITFYGSLNEIFNSGIPLSNNYQNIIPYNETIYAEVISNNDCFAIVEIPIVVNNIPVLLPDETVDYCLNNYPTTITLVNGAVNNPFSNYTYLWNTGETTPTIEINSIGTFTITVTNQNNCSNSRTINVLASNIATIDDIIIEEASSNNSVTVLVSGEGDYEFAIDYLGSFQDNNTFTNVEPGFHTVFIRDKNGCGFIEQAVSVLGFPKFFTPNNDGFNDTWQLFGVNSQFNQGAIVNIFDRYGKLITSFDNNSIGWDGSFNGQILPSSDYWFVAKLANGKEYRSHFTLKR